MNDFDIFGDEFLDVDFTKNPAFVGGDLGAPADGEFGSYEKKFGVLSDREIREAIEAQDAMGGSFDLMVTRCYHQKKEKSCTCNAIAQLREIAQAEEVGKENVVHLSALSLYQQVTDRDDGSNIGQANKAMREVGILPLDNAENKARYAHTMPNTGFGMRYPKGWKTTAAMLRSDEAFSVDSFEGFCSALLRGPLVGGRDGHAICYVRLRWQNGMYVADYINSWNDTWGRKHPITGLGGFGTDSQNMIKEARYASGVRSTRVQKV